MGSEGREAAGTKAMKHESFEELLSGMDEALRCAGGEHVPSLRVHFPPGEELAGIRGQARPQPDNAAWSSSRREPSRS